MSRDKLARQSLVAALKRAMRQRIDAIEPPAHRSVSPMPTAPSTPQFASAIAGPATSTAGSISFTTPLLCAILAGEKTQTRRPVRPVPGQVVDGVPHDVAGSVIEPLARCGERLTVRESCARLADGSFAYAADGPAPRGVRMNPARYMPREAARTFLRVHSVGVARLSAITEADALAEGAAAVVGATMFGAPVWFLSLWDSIYGETEFASAHDPWVWIIGFDVER